MSESSEAVAKREDHPPAETESDVTALVQLAIKEKVPVELLERVVALQERVSDRNARSAYIEAVGAFQAECTHIAKNKTAEITTKGGTKYGYTYASLDQITETIRPLLAQHGLSYSWDSSVNNNMVTVTCTLRHVHGHSESASFTAPAENAAKMSGAQKFASVLTYGRRQSLVQVLGLTVADDDTDGAEPADESPPIEPDQVADLEAKIEEVGADREKFLDWLGVESLSDLTQNGLGAALTALEQRARGRAP